MENDTTKWISLNESYEYLLQAMLDRIRSELDKNYWNTHQKEMVSPFDNTGETFEIDGLAIRAYNWDENTLPNLETKRIKVFWYKYSCRGVYALVPENTHPEDVIHEELDFAIKAIQAHFAKKPK